MWHLEVEHVPVHSHTRHDRIESVSVRSLRTGRIKELDAPWFIDASELGDFLPMTGTEWIVGAESQKETGELHAPEKGSPSNQQSFTWCFIVDHVPGTDNVIGRTP